VETLAGGVEQVFAMAACGQMQYDYKQTNKPQREGRYKLSYLSSVLGYGFKNLQRIWNEIYLKKKWGNF
jgi:hypothetical protein